MTEIEAKMKGFERLPLVIGDNIHEIAFTVRHWQQVIEDKFGRREAYLDFENDEVNKYKKDLLTRNRSNESGVHFNKHSFFHIVKDGDNWMDISIYIQAELSELNNISKRIISNCECDMGSDTIENIDFELYFSKVNIDLTFDYSFNQNVNLVNCNLNLIQYDENLNLKFEKKVNLLGTNIDFDGVTSIRINGECNISGCNFNNVNCDLEISEIFNVSHCKFNGLTYFRNLKINSPSKFNDLLFFFPIYFQGKIEINSTIDIGNYVLNDRMLTKSIVFTSSYELNMDFEEFYIFGLLSKVYLHNINLNHINDDVTNIVSFTKNTKNTKGEQAIYIDWKTCEPKPFRKVLSFKSNKKMFNFMQDFAVAFKEYVRIRQDEDIFVNIESVIDGYNIVFESSSAALIEEIKDYTRDFEEFLKDPASQFYILNQNVDKIESKIELMSILNKIIVKLQIYEKLEISGQGIPAFTLPNTEIVNSLLINIPNITNQFINSSFENMQLNQGDTISNPNQNISYSDKEISRPLS